MIAVAMWTTRNADAPSASDRCIPMTTADRMPWGARREAVSIPSTRTTVSMTTLATPVARDTNQRISFMPYAVRGSASPGDHGPAEVGVQPRGDAVSGQPLRSLAPEHDGRGARGIGLERGDAGAGDLGPGGRRRPPRARVDDVVALLAVGDPGPPTGRRRGDGLTGADHDLSDDSVLVLDADVPPADGQQARHGDVPAEVDEEPAAQLAPQSRGDEVRGVRLGGGAEVEHGPPRQEQMSARGVVADGPPAGDRHVDDRAGRLHSASRSDRVEVDVVARGGDRLPDRRV